MKNKYFYCCILIIAFSIRTIAQAPHISGTIKISVATGVIEGDITMENMPKITGYTIQLNSGLNVEYMRDSTDKFNYGFERYYDGGLSYESFEYFMPANQKGMRYLPKKFRIKYIGAFPVKSDTVRRSDLGDWKGNIANNGKYVRLSEQSTWYPVLYDTVKDVTYNKVTYDLNIVLDGGKSIYLNGSPPVAASHANFKSDIPRALLLFAGDFDFNKKDKTWFINTHLNAVQEQSFSNWTDRITKFYELKLNIPYGSTVTYLATSPVSKRNAWAFATYPTIAVIGNDKYSILNYFDEKTGAIKDSAKLSFVSHELGHYYFGTYLVPNAELSWVFLEGFNEYLSMQAVRDLVSENAYHKIVADYMKSMSDFTIIPLSKIKTANEVENNYRYRYVPLLLTALEKEIGRDQMWKWFNIILNSKDKNTDYKFFETTLLESGVSQTKISEFLNNYNAGPNAKQHLIDKLK